MIDPKEMTDEELEAALVPDAFDFEDDDQPAEEAEEQQDDPQPNVDEDGEEEIDGNLPAPVYRALKDAREKRRLAKDERDTALARVQALEAELDAIKAAAADPEPDRYTDPDKWAEWVRRDAERKLRVHRPAEPAGAANGAVPGPTQQRVAASALAARQRLADYDVVVSPIVHRMYDTDPKVRYRIESAADPGMEAYRVGEELIGRRQKKTGGAPAPEASPARSTRTPSRPTEEIIRTARQLGLRPQDLMKQVGRNV